MNVSSNINALFANALHVPKVSYSGQEARESVSGPDNDGDSDDTRVSSTQKNASAVNLSGQSIGQHISVAV